MQKQVHKINSYSHPCYGHESKAHHFHLRKKIVQRRSKSFIAWFNNDFLANAIIAQPTLLTFLLAEFLMLDSIKREKYAVIDGMSNVVLKHLLIKAIVTYTTLFAQSHCAGRRIKVTCAVIRQISSSSSSAQQLGTAPGLT